MATNLRIWVLVIAVLAAFALVIITSPAFRKCVQDENQAYSGKPTAEQPSALKTKGACFFNAMHESDGILTALATLLIGVFTFTLWQMAGQQEKSIRRHERAYIICGGLFGVIRSEHDTREKWARPKATYFQEPWRMAIYNYGRTPGYLTRIRWYVCPESEFPTGMSVTQIIESGRFKMHEPQYVQEVIPPVALKGSHLEYRHVSPERKVGDVFFGRIDYKDVFRRQCHSTFVFRHGKEHTDTLGASYSEDWT